MSYLPIVLLSYFLNSIAVTVDKFLLTKTIPDPLIYVFYFSLVSLFFLLGIPFTHIPSSQVIILASFSTLSWTAGAYFMFWALKIGQVQRVIPIIGTLTPLVLLLFATSSNSISQTHTFAVIILILGLMFLNLPDLGGKFSKKELLLEVLAGVLFALAYSLLKRAFLLDDFFSVFVWSRPILLPLGALLMIIPSLRNRILPFFQSKKGLKKGLPIFIFGQICAGFSELLLTFSISLTNPAIVNALQGVKYVYLLIFSLILGKRFPEIFTSRLSGYFLISEIAGITLIGVGLYLVAFAT